VAWIEALVSAQGLIGEEIIKDREQSVHSEFSQYHSRTKQLSEEYLSFPGSLPRQREVRFLQELPSIDKIKRQPAYVLARIEKFQLHIYIYISMFLFSIFPCIDVMLTD
jgi:hypothetical protein